MMRFSAASPSRLAVICATVLSLFMGCWIIFSLTTERDILAPFVWLGSPQREQPPPTTAAPGAINIPKPDHWKPPPTDPKTGIPEGVKVIGLVFYGRRDLVRVLDCYLKRNLKENGGILDEVIFTVGTENKDDLAYLEELLLTSPNYRKFEHSDKHDGWMGQWEAVELRDSVYIKIDDDVVFFEDTTIPSMVQRLLGNPQYFAVSANVVNNPALSWVHYHMGVSLPYWPEMEKPATAPPANSWRASELPPYKGPATGPDGFNADGSTPAPFPGHRWLPVQAEPGKFVDIMNFPAATRTYDSHGPSWLNWAATAQQHYSFLQHLEDDDLWRYKFDVWDYNYERISINFYALRGSDIIDNYPFSDTDDERYLSQVRPKELGRHVVVDGRGLAVHFAFGPQRNAHDGHAVGDTDALARYRFYSEEFICKAPGGGGKGGAAGAKANTTTTTTTAAKGTAHLRSRRSWRLI